MSDFLYFFAVIFISMCIWLIGYAVGYNQGLNKNLDLFLDEEEAERSLIKYLESKNKKDKWQIWRN